MIGKMYKLKPKYHGPNDDDFIVIEELTNTVALLNARTNNLVWVTKHVLILDYGLKEASSEPEGKPNEY
jgi:hypothetical protein